MYIYSVISHVDWQGLLKKYDNDEEVVNEIIASKDTWLLIPPGPFTNMVVQPGWDAGTSTVKMDLGIYVDPKAQNV